MTKYFELSYTYSYRYSVKLTHCFIKLSRVYVIKLYLHHHYQESIIDRCNNYEGTYKCSCIDNFELDDDGSTCLPIDPCDREHTGCSQVSFVAFSHVTFINHVIRNSLYLDSRYFNLRICLTNSSSTEPTGKFPGDCCLMCY